MYTIVEEICVGVDAWVRSIEMLGILFKSIYAGEINPTSVPRLARA